MGHTFIGKDKVEQAFRKLQSSIYYENNNLRIREQLADFMQDRSKSINDKLKEICTRLNSKDSFDKEIANIKLSIYPKKIKSTFSTPANFITNIFIDKEITIERYAIFGDFPIELHILAVLWLMELGYNLDKQLMNNCMGNRLIIDKDNGNIVTGKSLYKPYIKQYNQWWSNAIDKANHLLEEKNDVTIVNFDLQDYYHRVQFNFAEIEPIVNKELNDNDITKHLHQLFINMHKAYKEKLIEYDLCNQSKLLDNEMQADTYPLPIGLLSSPVLGNWFLNAFDNRIETQLTPVYYARYVDDIIIVFKNSVVYPDSKKNESELQAYFNKILKNNELGKLDINSEEYRNIVHLIIKNKFHGIFQAQLKDKEIYYSIADSKYHWLKLQKEKIFIYQFNHRFSPNLLKKFSEEQKERSSEYRFLSDEEDDSFENFDATTFESNFDNLDGNKARFKALEDNKFHLSVFLSKLIKRRIQRGSGYKNIEIEKIDKFFQGYYCLKYYFFWEKLFTLYLVSNKKELFIDLQTRILKFIEADYCQICKETLRNHLDNSMRMALGLNPTFFREDELTQIKNANLFRQTYLLRRHYMFYPLFQLTNEICSRDTSLIDSEILKKINKEKLRLNIPTDIYVPFDIKFHEACLFEFYTNIFTETNFQDDKIYKTWKCDHDFLSPTIFLKNAFKLFCRINDKRYSEDHQNQYYKVSQLDGLYPPDLKASEIYVPHSPKSQNISKAIALRIGLVNKYVDSKEYEKSLLGNRFLAPEEVEVYDNILDQIEKIIGCDVFVLPELSLPHVKLYEYIKQSEKKQIGFISGIEYVKSFNIGFNFVLTCLPINIDGIKDTIPIFRLKNHYSPDEECWIRGKHMLVPKVNYRYDLFHWNNVYFSTYYCFELANIIHRSIFCSKVDAIFAPLWNRDIYYYNNIAESTSRDLHCYFIQVNTSQYGETRVVRPTGHIRIDKARLKGGTTKENPSNVIVADIDISGLRDFQSVDYSEQKERNRDGKSFKPTPPDFSKKNVKTRMDGEMFKEDR